MVGDSLLFYILHCYVQARLGLQHTLGARGTEQDRHGAQDQEGVDGTFMMGSPSLSESRIILEKTKSG